MAGSRLDLHAELCEVLGSDHVYFSPPESVRMVYPAIVYKRESADTQFADNAPFIMYFMYSVTLIDEDPDTEIPEKILEHFRLCRMGTSYSADNLNHYPFTIYY